MELESVSSSPEICEHFPKEHLKLHSDYEQQNARLQGRIALLKDMMAEIRSDLTKEKELLKKELLEAQMAIQVKSNETICPCEEELSLLQEPTLDDMSVLDYEQRLSVYQEALARAHAEKRMHLRRHLTANAYKRRLLEVENMCNMELLKVKQNVQCLQPLQAMASEWYVSNSESTSLDDEIIGTKLKSDSLQKRDAFITLEEYESKENAESKESKIHTSPVHSSVGTSSSILQDEEDDALMLRRLQSMGWYNNEIGQIEFNPLM